MNHRRVTLFMCVSAAIAAFGLLGYLINQDPASVDYRAQRERLPEATRGPDPGPDPPLAKYIEKSEGPIAIYSGTPEPMTWWVGCGKEIGRIVLSDDDGRITELVCSDGRWQVRGGRVEPPCDERDPECNIP